VKAEDMAGNISYLSSTNAIKDMAVSSTSLNENVTANTTVGTLSNTDASTGNTYTYTLAVGTGDTDNGSFTITGTDLKINSSPNFEVKNSYDIRINVNDGTLDFAKQITITINDVNEAPTITSLNTFTVDENQTAVATLTVTDVDAGQTPTFSTTLAGTDSASFSITSAGVLTFNTAPDFETKSSYSVDVTATDGQTPALTDTQTITVIINNLNAAPTNISLSSSSIKENQIDGTVVGILSNTDDGENNPQTYTYSLACTTVGSDDSSFIISGTDLKQNSLSGFNYENKSVYNICIKVTETNGGLSYDKNFVITIEDVAEGKFSKRSSSSASSEEVCRDERATNYKKDGLHRQVMCNYGEISSITKIQEKSFRGEKCSTSQTLTQNLKSGDRDGKYST
jgi:VCBS repeat-containing protein